MSWVWPLHPQKTHIKLFCTPNQLDYELIKGSNGQSIIFYLSVLSLDVWFIKCLFNKYALNSDVEKAFWSIWVFLSLPLYILQRPSMACWLVGFHRTVGTWLQSKHKQVVWNRCGGRAVSELCQSLVLLHSSVCLCSHGRLKFFSWSSSWTGLIAFFSFSFLVLQVDHSELLRSPSSGSYFERFRIIKILHDLGLHSEDESHLLLEGTLVG